MSFITFGKYSINADVVLNSTLDELYERFPKHPKNVLLASWESVHGKVKKPKKKRKTDKQQ